MVAKVESVPIFSLSESELSIPTVNLVSPETCKLMEGSPLEVLLISSAVCEVSVVSISKAPLGSEVPIPTCAEAE